MSEVTPVKPSELLPQMVSKWTEQARTGRLFPREFERVYRSDQWSNPGAGGTPARSRIKSVMWAAKLSG